MKSNRGAYLNEAIVNEYGPAQKYTQAKRTHEKEQRKRDGAKHSQGRHSDEKAREGHQERFYGLYLAYVRERVGKTGKTQPKAFGEFQSQETEERHKLTSGPLAGRPLTQKALEVINHEASRVERARLFKCGRGVEIPGFWEWDEKINTEPFRG